MPQRIDQRERERVVELVLNIEFKYYLATPDDQSETTSMASTGRQEQRGEKALVPHARTRSPKSETQKYFLSITFLYGIENNNCVVPSKFIFWSETADWLLLRDMCVQYEIVRFLAIGHRFDMINNRSFATQEKSTLRESSPMAAKTRWGNSFELLTVNVKNADVVVTVVFGLTLVLTKTDHFVCCRPTRFLQ